MEACRRVKYVSHDCETTHRGARRSRAAGGSLGAPEHQAGCYTTVKHSAIRRLPVLYCDAVKVWGGVQAGSIEIHFPSHRN